MRQSPTSRSRENLSRARERLDAGRLGSYALMGAAIGAVPLPWVPEAVATRLRGALVHDLTARHGLTLEAEARALLSAPLGPSQLTGALGQMLAFAGARLAGRYAPLGFLSPLRQAVGTFVLGHLLHRYLSQRAEVAVRIDVGEARRVRRAMEEAIVRVFTTPAPPEPGDGPVPDESRDDVTKLTDTLFSAVASVPGWLVRRLDGAFDAALERSAP